MKIFMNKFCIARMDRETLILWQTTLCLHFVIDNWHWETKKKTSMTNKIEKTILSFTLKYFMYWKSIRVFSNAKITTLCTYKLKAITTLIENFPKLVEILAGPWNLDHFAASVLWSICTSKIRSLPKITIDLSGMQKFRYIY